MTQTKTIINKHLFRNKSSSESVNKNEHVDSGDLIYTGKAQENPDLEETGSSSLELVENDEALYRPELTYTSQISGHDLLTQCQNSKVLSHEELTQQAKLMELARANLTQQLVDSDKFLVIMANEFIKSISMGIDLSELVNKTGNDSNEVVQTENVVQETAKQLEQKLVNCFQIILNSQEQAEEFQSSKDFLQEIHFLPNFLQQVIYLIKTQINQASENDTALTGLDNELSRMIQSRQAMINGNLRLVTFVARQYNNQTLSFNDLIQDGTVGLIKAVDRFDWKRSVRFSTYAIYWIRQTISRAMVRQEKMVRLPYNIAAKAAAVFEIMNNWLVQNNRWPSTKELSVACNMPEDEVKAIVENYQPTVSLSSYLNDDEDMPEVEDTLEQHHYPQPLSILTSTALKNCLRKAVKTLPEREADIINCRFGLDNHQEMTLQDIAEKLCLTRERVRQIQNSALLKLKTNFSKDLLDFLEPG